MRRFSLAVVLSLLIFAAGFHVLASALPEDAPSDSSASQPAGDNPSPAQPAPVATKALATPAARPADDSGRPPFTVGVGVKVSPLGIGLEAAVPISRRSNVRAGFNAFSYGQSFSNDGIHYDATLNLRSVQSSFDWYPFAGRFHLSPGVLLYNDNHVTANLNVPIQQSFTLNHVTYFANSQVSGTGKLVTSSYAPMFLVGWGNLVPRHKHIGFSFEAGVVYQGEPKTTLNLTGTACTVVGCATPADIATDPTIQANVQAEEAKLNRSVSPYRFFPLLSFGFGYKF